MGCWLQESGGDARAIVQAAVKAELTANDNDHTRWRYRDSQKDGTETVSLVVQTDHGSVKRLISRGGHPLSETEAWAENARVQEFIHDPVRMAKQHRDSAQDDRNARELTKMLPDAFRWKIESEDAERVTLGFEPNPGFDPPDMHVARAGQDGGETGWVDKKQHRIYTMSGRLTEDVTIGWGLLGRLREGWDVSGRAARVGSGALADYGEPCAHRGQGSVL